MFDCFLISFIKFHSKRLTIIAHFVEDIGSMVSR